MSYVSDELLLTELKIYLRRDIDTLLSQRNELQASVINLTTQRDALIYEITSKVLNEDVLNRLSSHVTKSEHCLFDTDTDLELSSPLIKTEPYSFVIESEPSSSILESEPSSSVSELEPLLPVAESPLRITDSNQEELGHDISSENPSVDKEQVTYKFLEDVYELNDIIVKEKKPVPSSPTEIDKFLNDIYGLDEIENNDIYGLDEMENDEFTNKVANLLRVNPVENIDTFLEVAYELNEEKQNDGIDEPIHYTKHHSTHHQKHHDRHNDK